MKQFASIKPLEVIQQQCAEQGLVFNDRLYREQGWDTVLIQGGDAQVVYNTFNGRFFGWTPNGEAFSSDECVHEDEPWFQALLSFFYVEKQQVEEQEAHA